jgi:pyruvate dehydrogenase (quinone)
VSTLAVGANTSGSAGASPSETEALVTPQPAPRFTPDENTSDIIVETLIAWGATHAFSIVGDGINPIIEPSGSVRTGFAMSASDMRRPPHSWPAASQNTPAASGSASERRDQEPFTFLNGLMMPLDSAPVIALTGLTFHDLIGVRYQQASIRFA